MNRNLSPSPSELQLPQIGGKERSGSGGSELEYLSSHSFSDEESNPNAAPKRWDELPEHLQAKEAETVRHRDPKSVGLIAKLSLLTWKAGKHAWRSRILFFSEFSIPFLSVLIFAIYISDQIPPDLDKRPIIYTPFLINDIRMRDCRVIVITPNNFNTRVIAKKMKNDLLDKLSGKYTYKVKAELDKDWEDHEVCAVVEFLNLPDKLSELFPLEVNYKIRLPALQHHEETLHAFSSSVGSSLWNSAAVYFRDGPRNRFENEGGSPGYYTEGFLYLQRKVDCLLLQMIYDRTRSSTGGKHFRPCGDDVFHVQLQRFPHPKSQNYNLVPQISHNLPAMLIFCYLVTFLSNIYMLLVDKLLSRKHLLYFEVYALQKWAAWMFYKMVLHSIFLILIVTLLCSSWKYDRAVINKSESTYVYFFLWSFIFHLIVSSCFCSSFFLNPLNGCIASIALWVVSILPLAYSKTHVSVLPNWEKVLFCFTPNLSLLIGLQLIALAEVNGEGMSWSSFMTEDFDLGHVICVMYCSTILQILIALYATHLTRSSLTLNATLKFYFPFTKWWWKGNCPPVSFKEVKQCENTQTIEFIKPINFEPIRKSTDLKIGLSLLSVSKAPVDGLVPLKNINLTFYENEIFSILGNDEGGKETLFALCAGLIPPSRGTVWIRRHDMKTHGAYSRANTGYCSKDNFLFDYLTVEEHLSFFLQLKGQLNGREAFDEIERVLGGVDMMAQRKDRASTLTEGWKRMLHIAIAFVGGSKLILLNDPTLFMDIPAQRTAWRFIYGEKALRTIVIFTNFSDEALYLSDRMAILVHGEIYCRGSSAFVKNKLGAGYHLEVKGSKLNIQEILHIVIKSIPNTRVESSGGRSVKLFLPQESTPFFPKCFKELEESKAKLAYEKLVISFMPIDEIYSEISCAKISTRTKEVIEPKALYHVNTEADLTEERRIQYYTPVMAYLQQFLQLFKKEVKFASRNVGKIALSFTVCGLIIHLGGLTFDSLDFTSDITPIELNFDKLPYGLKKRGLMNCIDDYDYHKQVCNYVNETLSNYVPSVIRGTGLAMEPQIIGSFQKTLMTYEASYIIGVNVEFRAQKDLVTVYFNNKFIHAPPIAVNFYSNLLLLRLYKQTKIIKDNRSTVPKIITINHPLPYTVTDKVKLSKNYQGQGYFEGLTLAWAAIFYVPILSFVYPLEHEFKHIQIQAGVNLFLFWASKVLYHFLMMIISTLIIIMGIGSLLSPPGFTTVESRIASMVLLCCFAFCATSIQNLLSFSPVYYTTRRRNLFFSIMIFFFLGPMPMSLLAFMAKDPYTNQAVHDNHGHTKFFSSFFHVLPGYNLGMGIFNIFSVTQIKTFCGTLDSEHLTCSLHNHECCDEPSYYEFGETGLGANILLFIIEGAIANILIFLLESNMFRKIKQIWKNYLFYVKHAGMIIPERFKSKKNKIKPKDIKTEVEELDSEMFDYIDPEDYEIVIQDLCKKSHGRTIFEKMNFAVKKGQCFGILGDHGSGASSTVRLMGGVELPTSGDVTIQGISLVHEYKKYITKVGFYSRTPMLFNYLTGRELLYLVGTLRKIKKQSLIGIINIIAVRLLVFTHLDRLVRDMVPSVKNKFSIAVALIGAPDVLLFDEPGHETNSTSRNEIIKTIAMERGISTVVLSSRRMDLAEKLCDKVCILVDGKIRCMGSPQYLKDSYCSGFVIIAYLVPEDASFYKQKPIRPGEKPAGPSSRVNSIIGKPNPKQRLGSSVPSIHVTGADEEDRTAPPPTVPKRRKYPSSTLSGASFRLTPKSSKTSINANAEDLLEPWERELAPLKYYIESEFPNANLLDSYPCFVHYHISGELELSSIFQKMEIARIALELETYRVGAGSLSDLLHCFSKGQKHHKE